MSQKRQYEESGIHLRTRKKRRCLEYKGSATIQDIPVEVMWKIAEYVGPESYLILRNLCRTFSNTLTVMFYHFYKTIPRKILAVRKLLSERLYSSSMEEESQRLEVTKSLLYLDWLETELVTLGSILWRYGVTSESHLFPDLWPILEEIKKRIESLTKSIPFSDIVADIRVLNPSLSLPLWSNFIEQFDQNLEPSLGRPFPFETRVVDILTCCPSSNIVVDIKRSRKGDTVHLKAFFQIHDACSIKFRPMNTNDEDFERSILKFLRFIVRTRNSLHIRDMFDDIRSLECRLISKFMGEIERNTVILLLEDRYRDMDSSVYEPLTSMKIKRDKLSRFVRQTTYNVSSNFLECSLEKNSLNSSEMPLIATHPQLFRVEEIPSPIVSIITSRLSGKQKSDENETLFKLRIFFKNLREEVDVNVRKDQNLKRSENSYVMTEDIQLPRLETNN